MIETSIAGIVMLGKQLAPLAKLIGPAAKAGRWWWTRWPRRVAADVSKQAPFPVPKRSLRKALRSPEILRVLGPNNEDSAAKAVAVLRSQMDSTKEWRDLTPDESIRRATRVIVLVQQNLLKYLDPSQAVSTADSRSQQRHIDQMDAIRGVALIVEADRRIETLAAALPPFLHKEIVAEMEQESRLKELVYVIADSVNPTDALVEWSESPPKWLESAGGHAWAVFGEALGAYGLVSESGLAMTKAVEKGVSRRSYWSARIALLEAVTPATADSLENSSGQIQHPLTKAIIALGRNETRDGLSLLEDWEPESPRENHIRLSLKAEAERVLDRPQDQVRTIETLIGKYDELSTPRLHLATILLSRVQKRSSQANADDVQRAVELAIEARDRRRRWRGNSTEAAILATKALMMAHDYRRMRLVATAEPAGEATFVEGASPELKSQAARAAALMGYHAEALELVADTTEYAKAEVAAIIAEAADDGSASARMNILKAWRDVRAAATTDEERVASARGAILAGIPKSELSDLSDEMRDLLKDTFELVRALGIGDDSLSRDQVIGQLQLAKQTEPYAAVVLSQMLEQLQGPVSAADELSAAADRFGDQVLRLMAASILFSAELYEAAAKASSEALAKAPGAWPGRRRALMTLIDSSQALGRWDDAASHAAQLISIDPHNERAAWILALALWNDDKADKAWASLQRNSSGSPRPTGQQEGLLLLRLTRLFGERRDLFALAVELIRANQADDDFVANVLVVAYAPVLRNDADGSSGDADPAGEMPELLELNQLFQQFSRDFPEHPALTTISGDENEFLEKIKNMMRQGAAARAEVTTMVMQDKWPVGMLATVSSKPYALTLLVRGGGHHFVHSAADAAELTASRETVERVLDPKSSTRTLLDLSAIHILSVLTPSSAAVLRGSLAAQYITGAGLHDIRATRHELEMPAAGYLSYNSSTDELVWGEPNAEEQERIRARVKTMISSAESLSRLPAAPPTDTSSGGRRSEAWFGNITVAANGAYVFWCDDAVLRQVARAQGVAAFGTVDLAEELTRRGRLSNDHRLDMLITLVRDYAVDVPMAPGVLSTVAAYDNWEPRAAAFALSRLSTWRDAEMSVAVLREAIGKNWNRLELVEHWIRCAARALTDKRLELRIAGDNVSFLLQVVVNLPTASPAVVRAALNAIRAETQDRGIADPWPNVCRALHKSLLDGRDEEQAAAVALAMCAELNPDDRRTMMAVIFDPRRRPPPS